METNQFFKSNVDSYGLKMNATFEVFKSDRDYKGIQFRTPTISDILDNPDTQRVLGIIYADKEYIKELELPFNKDTRGKFIYGMTFMSEIGATMLEFWEKYIVDFSVKDNLMYSKNVSITSEVLEYISDIILISAGYKSLEEEEKAKRELAEEQGLSAFELKMLKKERAAAERLRKAKEKKQQNKENYTQDQIVIAVMHEFNMTLEDIKKINYYTLYWYFGYALKIDYHKVMQIAAGNGILDKKARYSHWL